MTNDPQAAPRRDDTMSGFEEPETGQPMMRAQEEDTGEQIGYLPPRPGGVPKQAAPAPALERRRKVGVKFHGEVLSVQAKSKKTKANTDDEMVEKIGRLTIQFDGNAVDATALAELVNGRIITLELDDTQRSLRLE